jgi:hypothetical protein
VTRYARLGTPWRRVLGLCIVATGLMTTVAARPGSLWPLQGLTVGLIAAGTAWCVDEQAAPVVDTLPRNLRWRTTARTLVACPLAITWVLCILIWRRELPPHPAVLILQGITAMAAAVAYGAWRRAHGAAAPGGGFAVAAVTACVAVTLAPLGGAESALFPAWSVGGWRTCGLIWTAMLSGSTLVLCITLRQPDARRPSTRRGRRPDRPSGVDERDHSEAGAWAAGAVTGVLTAPRTSLPMRVRLVGHRGGYSSSTGTPSASRTRGTIE